MISTFIYFIGKVLTFPGAYIKAFFEHLIACCLLYTSSLGSTARQKPMSASIFIPSRVCTEVCVEACRGISGAALRISEVSPISCKILSLIHI